MGMNLLRKIINREGECYHWMVDKVRPSKAIQEKVEELARMVHLGERKICDIWSYNKAQKSPTHVHIKADRAAQKLDCGYSVVKDKSRHIGRIQIKIDEACEKSPTCVHIAIPGRKPFCFGDVSETETIGTLTEKIADSLGVDKRNWGFYVAGPKTQREFLPDGAKVQEINHNNNLHFLPRTVIR